MQIEWTTERLDPVIEAVREAIKKFIGPVQIITPKKFMEANIDLAKILLSIAYDMSPSTKPSKTLAFKALALKAEIVKLSQGDERMAFVTLEDWIRATTKPGSHPFIDAALKKIDDGRKLSRHDEIASESFGLGKSKIKNPFH